MDYFDQIFPLNSSGREVGGYINVLNEDFYVHIVITDGPPKRVGLRGTWKLQQLLKPVNKILQQHFGQCDTFSDILQELKNTLEQQLKAEKIMKELPVLPLSYYKKLLEQLEDCGWDKVHDISTELNKIKLKVSDSCERSHILHVILPQSFPNEAPTCESDVPGIFSFGWSSESTISDLCSSFESYVNSYNLFWNCMDEIDNNTWVLEPENPNRSDCKRRIALSSTASLLIIVNPRSPTSVPVCHFLGPERTVGPLREKFNSNINRWDENDSLLYNLKALMEMEFPSPMTSAKEDYCIACGICYAYQLGDSLPDISCEDLNCNQPFHHSCLYEWFRSLPTARHSFNTVFGECPYCNKPLSCTMP